jgi:predicted DNA binding CopG/RHH family protein
MSKKIPEFRTDEELEAFLEQDLSDYVTPENFKPARFEWEQGISYQRYIRQAVERALDDRR